MAQGLTCPDCGDELVEVDNPMRREVRHRRGRPCGVVALAEQVAEPVGSESTVPDEDAVLGVVVGGVEVHPQIRAQVRNILVGLLKALLALPQVSQVGDAEKIVREELVAVVEFVNREEAKG